MNLVFNAADHTYMLNGTLVPGVTTVVGLLPKPWMGPWVAKENAETTLLRLKAICDRDGMLGYPEAVQAVKDSKKAYKIKSELAAGIGTEAHTWFETYIREMREPDEFTAPEVRNAFKHFKQWQVDHKVVWLESELVVGSEAHMYGGKLDAIAFVDGKLTLLDFKTSNDIHELEFGAQIAGYRNAYDEMRHGQGAKIEQHAIVWLPKTGTKYKYHIIKIPYEQCREVFISALGLYRALKVVEGNKLKEAA